MLGREFQKSDWKCVCDVNVLSPDLCLCSLVCEWVCVFHLCEFRAHFSVCVCHWKKRKITALLKQTHISHSEGNILCHKLHTCTYFLFIYVQYTLFYWCLTFFIREIKTQPKMHVHSTAVLQVFLYNVQTFDVGFWEIHFLYRKDAINCSNIIISILKCSFELSFQRMKK